MGPRCWAPAGLDEGRWPGAIHGQVDTSGLDEAMVNGGQWRAFLAPAAVAAAVLVIFVQLPAPLLDFLVAANLALAAVILLTAFYVRTPLEFSLFPTVLLGATLARLVLNIASTRLILTRGDTAGLNAAGQVIRSFGEFVTGDRLLVGLLLFLIIATVQFLVITSGATRISEVAARFSLDGMPGRQLAVDADLNSGVIDEPEARRRREEISLQSDFYGAMDGASKFVRGDAIAGMVILGVNIVGGVAVGWQAGLGVAESAALYTKLTIGDGLVGQLPALLVSLAAGVLVTRGAARRDLPTDLIKQVFSRPESMVLAALFLAALLAARMPVAPMLAMSAACGLVGFTLIRRERKVVKQQAAQQAELARQERVRAAAPGPLKRPEDFLKLDPLVLELGVGLLRLADPKRGGDLLARVSQLREQLAAEMGILLPSVRVRDSVRLEHHAYRLLVDGATAARGELRSSMPMAIAWSEAQAAALETLPGSPAVDPVDGRAARWIPATAEADAAAAGCQVFKPVDVLMRHFHETMLAQAPNLLSREMTRKLLDQLREEAPRLVADLEASSVDLGTVQRALQMLAAERVSLRPLSHIVETLLDCADEDLSSVELLAHVRRRLRRSLWSSLLIDQPAVPVVLVGGAWEDALQRGDASQAGESAAESLRRESEKLSGSGRTPVALVRPEARWPLRQAMASRAPRLRIIARDEIPPELLDAGVAIETAAVVDLPPAQATEPSSRKSSSGTL